MLKENLLSIYADSFKDHWSLPALTDYITKETMTYGDFAKAVAYYHLLFEQLGIQPGDKIALMGKNTTTWVTVFMSTITYGAVIVPVLQEFNPRDAQHIINHSDADLLFVSNNLWETFEFEKMPKLKAAFSLEGKSVLAERDVDDSPSDVVAKIYENVPSLFKAKYGEEFEPKHVVYPQLSPDSLAVINYTSGTTGFSKGVMLTLNNLCGNVTYGIQSRLHYSGSKCLSFLPLAHAYGCAFDLLTPLAVGSHITLFGRLPSPKLLLKAMSEIRPNLVLCVPLVIEKIYRNQILPMITKQAMRWALAIPFLDAAICARIRRRLVEAFGGEFEEVIIGGAPLNHEVEDFLHRINFPFTVGYGMTECGPLISHTPWRQFQCMSSGRTLPIMESRIDSPDPENIPGEICVRGENVMKGYYKRPDATAEVIDSEGWLHTGDMGTRSADGTIFIKGRYKTMILTANGQNIYPEEIEAKLNNMLYVSESLVVERGKHLVALVYPNYDEMDEGGVTTDALPEVMERVRTELNKLVAPYEKIDRIQLVANEFEKTPKRSIKRYKYQ